MGSTVYQRDVGVKGTSQWGFPTDSCRLEGEFQNGTTNVGTSKVK